jgi:hypothetical protein
MIREKRLSFGNEWLQALVKHPQNFYRLTQDQIDVQSA